MKLLSILLATAIATLSGTGAMAEEGNFKKKHPRRAEVLNRANKQKKKNEADEKAGKLTEKQEEKLNRQDNRIKRQEEAEAAANGGHITKGEQQQLNREENRVNAERARMEKRNAQQKNNNTGGTGGDNTQGQ